MTCVYLIGGQFWVAKNLWKVKELNTTQTNYIRMSEKKRSSPGFEPVTYERRIQSCVDKGIELTWTFAFFRKLVFGMGNVCFYLRIFQACPKSRKCIFFAFAIKLNRWKNTRSREESKKGEEEKGLAFLRKQAGSFGIWTMTRHLDWWYFYHWETENYRKLMKFIQSCMLSCLDYMEK